MVWDFYLPPIVECMVSRDCSLLTVYNRIKLQVDLQADKSLVVVKGPFFPRVVNPRYRIRGTMRDARVDLIKQRNIDLQEVKPMHLIIRNIKTNLIY
jgi:exoribonuclease R